MAGPEAVKAAAPIDIPHFGKLSMAPNASAPLLVVFGGINVQGRASGIYMWDYMNNIKDRYHIFVAASMKWPAQTPIAR